MSGILGGGASNALAVSKFTQINIQTSAQGVPIPLVWGCKRMGDNLIWYNDFQAIPVSGGKKGGSSGGKGGSLGKGTGGTAYNYFAAVIMALCEGPITGIGTVWADTKLSSLSELGLSLFTGTASQATWSFLTSNHPDQALSYAYTCYLANSKYALGQSGTLPNHNFEIITPLSGSMPGTVDVNMADVIYDFLTNPQYSLDIPIASIDLTSLALYKTYIQAQGLFMSPDITAQEQASSVLDRWGQLTNTWIFWSGAALKFVPLGDTAITANGVTYTPSINVTYMLSYDDLIQDGSSEPLTVTRSDPADAPNRVKLEIKDRTNQYNGAVAQWEDQGLADQYGEVDSTTTQAYEICDTGIGAMVAQLVGQRSAYLRNEYDFKVGWEIGSFLEPGDIVTLTDPHIGISAFPVRICTADEDDNGNWAVNAEEFPGGIGTVYGARPAQSVTNITVDTEVDPGDVNPPAIFEPDSSLTGGTPQIWVAASGGANWGGALVSLSFDNANFTSAGSISASAAQGVLTADLPDTPDPDTTDTLAIDTTESAVVLPTDATNADADAFRTLCWLTAAYTTTAPAVGELIAYGAVAAGAGPFASNLTYLRRGLHNTADADHPIGSFFTRINLNQSTPPGNTMLIYDLPEQYIGTTIYLKFQSFNRFGSALQDISSVVDYQYTPTGAGFGGGTGGVPLTPTGLAATAGVQSGALSWNANATSDNVDYYEIFRAPGTGALFAAAVLIASTPALNYLDSGLAAGTGYTYFLKAHNAVGLSSATAGVNLTTLSTQANLWNPVVSLTGTLPNNNQELFVIPLTYPASLPVGLTGSTGGCETAPTADAIFTLYKNGSSIGTAKIAAGASGRNVASFTFSSAVSFAADDNFSFNAPSPQDATLNGFYFSFEGSR